MERGCSHDGISIHAPARGATPGSRLSGFCSPHFNPRSRKGSDNTYNNHWHIQWQFQSTLPQGERRGEITGDYRGWSISIHAPARGATVERLQEITEDGAFQSTLPQGERHAVSARQALNKEFQSTLPQGERPLFLNNLIIFALFQSTLPQGERQHVSSLHPYSNRISIHAPARGATVSPSIGISAVSNFNPRSRKGSDIIVSDMYNICIWISIHAPARGATMWILRQSL